MLEPRLAAALQSLGVALEQEVVIDPLDHYSTDLEVVAIPIYEPHAITRNLALTFFPGVRPITLRAAPEGVKAVPLFLSSTDSYTRPVKPVTGRDRMTA